MLAGWNHVWVVLIPCWVTRNICLSIVKDGIAKSNLVSCILESLFQVAGRKTPWPTSVVTWTNQDRVALTQRILGIFTGLNLEETLLAIVVVDVPNLAKVIHQFIFRCSAGMRATAGEFLQDRLSFSILTLVEICLCQHTFGSTAGSTTDVVGR